MSLLWKVAIALPAPPQGLREKHGFDHDVYGQRPSRDETTIPVKHGGYAGYVHGQPYEGFDEETKAIHGMDKDFGDDDFDQDAWEHTAPHPTRLEEQHHDLHGEYPDSYHDRHDQAYAEHMDRQAQETAPVHHNDELHSFLYHHLSQNEGLWREHAKPQQVNLKQPVYATQPYLVEKHLNRYLGNRFDSTDRVHQSPNAAEVYSYHADEMPAFVKHQDRMHTVEGHHRVAAELLRGTPHITGRVYDADKHGFPENPDEDWG